MPLHVVLVTARRVLWEEYCDLLSDPFVRVRGDLQEAGKSMPGAASLAANPLQSDLKPKP